MAALTRRGWMRLAVGVALLAPADAAALGRVTLRFGGTARLAGLRLTLSEIESWDHYDDGSFDAFAQLTARRGGRTESAQVSAFAAPQSLTLLGRRLRVVAATRDALVIEA